MFILPVIILLASIVLGWLFEKVLLRWLTKLADRTAWKGDDIIIGSLKGMFFSTFIVLGVYFAVDTFRFNYNVKNIIVKVLASLLIFMVTIIAARVSVGFVNQSTTTADRIFPASTILKNIIRIIVFAVGALIILNSLHISITPIITALGVGGLALALALQPTLSNLFSGIQIIASKQLLPGQYISLENGQEGSVEDITWRYTEIRSPNNNMITIPNSKISEAMITNYHKADKEIALFVPLRVGFNADLDLVEKTSKETAKKVMQDTVGGAKDFEPLVRFAKFGEAGIEFN
ncbi:MAG: mechanosensitive ion channel domain-containing protein, partial [Pseudomonadota bacterium]